MKTYSSLLAVAIVFLSAVRCEAADTVSAMPEGKRSRIAVVSTLGDVFTSNEKLYALVSKTDYSIEIDLVEHFETTAINYLKDRVSFEPVHAPELRNFKYMNKIFPGEPLYRMRALKARLFESGYDGIIHIRGENFVSGHSRTFVMEELGIYHFTPPLLVKKEPEADRVFVNFFITYISRTSGKWKFEFSKSGLDRVESVVQFEEWPSEPSDISEDVLSRLVEQCRDVADRKIVEILEAEFGSAE